MQNEMQKNPGFQNIDTDLRTNTPELRVRVNRDKVLDVGANVDVVGRTLETMLGGRLVTRFKMGWRTVRRYRAGRPRRS